MFKANCTRIVLQRAIVWYIWQANEARESLKLGIRVIIGSPKVSQK